MALLHPADRVSTIRPHAGFTERKIHPAICLVGGFGFIIVAALAVHFGFNALF